MEFTRRYLPVDWEERWRKEKERKKKVIEEGGAGVEKDNRELRGIVAYNDSRMGLIKGSVSTDASEESMSGTSQEASGGHVSEQAFRGEGNIFHFCCCKVFPKDVFVTLKDFKNSSLLTDLSLMTDDGSSLDVHSVVLAAVSTFVLDRLKEHLDNTHEEGFSKWSVLVGAEVDRVGLQAVVEFAYSGDVSSLNKDNFTKIKAAAQVLQVPPLVQLCNKPMTENLTGFSKQEQPRLSVNDHLKLLEEANDFVLRNFREVSATEKFQDLSAEKLLEFLRCDGLCVPSELAAFRAVISWIGADPEERLAQAPSLMTGVRFPLMTFREFREVRAINLRMECVADKEVELYGSALKEFGFGVPNSEDCCRVRRPRNVLAVIGGDQLNQDVGQRVPSREIWFANSLRNGTGLVKDIEWKRLGEIPERSKFRHGAAVMDGMLYVAGGCYFYAKDDIMNSKDSLGCLACSYDPMKERWKRLADMQESRSNFSVVVHEDHLYAIGGDKELNTNTHAVEMYTPETDTWSFVQPLDQALSGYGVTSINGAIFISGGFNCKYVCLATMFLYHPERGAVYLADMTHDRAQHCMEALQGHLYVAGGVCNFREFYADQPACEVYDPVADSWASFASLPAPHVGAASAVLEDKIYVLGGYAQDDYSESGLVHRFDPSAQRWESVGKLPGAVTDIRACVLHLPHKSFQSSLESSPSQQQPSPS
uniref:Si:ch211-63p21.8 n=1 Tax=Nothobranchius furzeri TaxID=105023 RepID=A0A8C6M349_NOTFU